MATTKLVSTSPSLQQIAKSHLDLLFYNTRRLAQIQYRLTTAPPPPHRLRFPHNRVISNPPPPPPRLRFSPMSSLSSPPPPSPPSKTVRVVIKGTVQGVFYRNWTVENARELGLKGWVRNRRDGSVEALFSGTADKVGEMEQRCRRGPPAAIITGLDVFPSTDDPGTGFEHRPTV